MRSGRPRILDEIFAWPYRSTAPTPACPRQGSEHLVGLCAVPRFSLLDASDASDASLTTPSGGVQDTVPTHPRSHIVDNSVMICRASLVGYSISSRHPRTSGSVSPRSGIRFRAPPIRFYLVEVSGRPPGTGRRCPTCYHRCQRNGRP